MNPFGVILLLWLAVFPLAPDATAVLWQAHIAFVAILLSATARLVWRRRRVSPGLPFAATALALVSLAFATWNRPGFPQHQLWSAATTGCAHAAFFLACLAFMPSVRAGDEAQDGASESARRWLTWILAAFLLGQVGSFLLAEGPDDPAWRPSGTVGNPNAFGTLVVACGLALAGFWRWRPLVLLLLAPLGWVVLATRSRGAVAAGGIVLTVFLWRRWGWRAPACVALLALAVLFVPNPLGSRVRSMQPEHTFDRTFLWGRALEGIAESPRGIGPAMNKYVFPERAYDPERPWLLHQRHAVGLTHNAYLTLTLEWGWLAGGAALLLTAWSAARLTRRRSPDPLRQGATLGAAVLFVELQVDGIEQNPVAFSVFLLLLATALRRTSPGAPRFADERASLAALEQSGAGGWSVSGRVAGGAIMLVALGLFLVAGSAHGRAAFLTLTRDMLEEFAERGREVPIAHAVRVEATDATRSMLVSCEAEAGAQHPEPPRLRFEFERAVVKQRLADGAPLDDPALLAAVDGAWAAMARARDANPRDVYLPRQAANFALLLFRRLGGEPRWIETYFEAMDELLTLDPLDVGARFATALEAHRHDRLVLRDALLAEVFRLEPDDAWAWLVVGRLHEADAAAAGGGAAERALHAYVRAEEALLNCHLLAQVGNPRSRSFYGEILAKVERQPLRRRIARLRAELYR